MIEQAIAPLYPCAPLDPKLRVALGSTTNAGIKLQSIEVREL